MNDLNPMTAYDPSPPVPTGEAARIGEAGRRRSILEGTWRLLLASHLVAQLGHKRAAMAGIPDISSNLMKQIVTQIAVLHRREPSVTHEDRDGLALLHKELAAANTWALAQKNQRLALAVNESVMVVGWRGSQDGDGRLLTEVVPADFVHGEEHHQDPSQFGVFYRARRRHVLMGLDGERKEVWTWDQWDVRPVPEGAAEGSPESLRPFFRILSEDKKADLTSQFIVPEEWRGSAYPYRKEDGTPLIPAVLYHAEAHSGLWDPWGNSEVVFGTLQDATNWTNTNHAFMRASWAQRYIGGGSIRGTVTKTADGEKVAIATEDPASATQIRSDGDGSLVIGQWGASVDIEKAERFARNYGLRLSVHFGLSPADISFESRGPSSGVALTVSRDGLRKIQERYAPGFRKADILYLEASAAVLRANGVAVPADGYNVEYAAVELSPEEKKVRLTNAREELEMGLTTKVRVILDLNPGISEEEAERLLQDVRSEIEEETAPATSSASLAAVVPGGEGPLEDESIEVTETLNEET